MNSNDLIPAIIIGFVCAFIFWLLDKPLKAIGNGAKHYYLGLANHIQMAYIDKQQNKITKIFPFSILV